MSSGSFLELLQPAQWPLLVLVSARVGGMMLVAPVWSSGLVPLRVRGAVAIALTVLLAPLVPAATLEINPPGILVPLVTEAFIGFAIGFSAATILYGITVVAEVISLQMGLSLGPAFGGPSDTGSPGVGQYYHQLFLMIYVGTGGMVAMVRALAESFGAIPPGGAIAVDQGIVLLTRLGAAVFSTAVEIAGPVMVALLLANLALAVLNRAIPQLNTMMVAVPITIAVGLIAMGGALPATATMMAGWVNDLPGQSNGLIHSLIPSGGP